MTANPPKISDELKAYFLPYQKKFIRDHSPLILAPKSRRIGLTHSVAFKAILFCLEDQVNTVYKIGGQAKKEVHYASADASAAVEFLDECARWLEVYDEIFEDTFKVVDDVQKRVIILANGYKIWAHSSNPRAFRGYAGMVILDEFAHHDDQEALWTAASGTASMAGYPIILISSLNGKNNTFYDFMIETEEAIEKGTANHNTFSLHKVNIEQAVAEGIADVYKGRKLSDEERAQYIQDLKEKAKLESTYLQEYMIQAMERGENILPYELIEAAERRELKYATTAAELRYLIASGTVTGDIFLGVDIGRFENMTVITGIEKKKSGRAVTRFYAELYDAAFEDQQDFIYELLEMKEVVRCHIDKGGMGEPVVERLQSGRDYKKHGWKVHGSAFQRDKEKLAFLNRRYFEDHNVEIICREDYKTDLHSVQKVINDNGKQLVKARNLMCKNPQGEHRKRHGDSFFSLALALDAMEEGPDFVEAKVSISTGIKRIFSGRSRMFKIIDFIDRYVHEFFEYGRWAA